VGSRASRIGVLSEQVESVADEIGANDPGASTLLYRAVSVLYDEAIKAIPTDAPGTIPIEPPRRADKTWLRRPT
jgi:hypothetical protein